MQIRKLSLVSMLWACAAAANAQVETASDSPFGVVCPWPGVKEAGIKWCRVGAGATALANWPDIEKSAGVWDWRASDNELRQLADPQGLSLLPIFGYTPRWASTNPEDAEFHFCPPKDLTQFSRFVRQCVARYKHRVKVWEVWNEPNIGFFHGSAAEYAQLVKTAAIAARQEDPDCRIAMGCAGVDIDFLQRLYEFGCGPYFDVMSVHPYQWGQQLNAGWMLDKLQGCRHLMDQHGDQHKPIWATEIGWSLAEGVTAQEQADLLVQALVTLLSVRERLQVEKMFWFCVKDWGGPGHGLFDVAGQPKPALVAYRALTVELGQARYCGPWRGPVGVQGHVFDRAGTPVLVLWNPAPVGKTRVQIKTSAPKIAVRTIADQQNQIAITDATLSLEATHAPLFVTGLTLAELSCVPAPPAAPRKVLREALRDVWLSVLPPPSTARPYLRVSGQNELPIQIHNDGRPTARGELQIELATEKRVLAAGKIPFQVEPGKTQTAVWSVTLGESQELAGQLGRLHVRGSVAGDALAPLDLPVRLVRSQAIEFAANSWIERQYLHHAEKAGCADSIRFGAEFGYRFSLGPMRSGQLRINVGANGANPWSLLLSQDDKSYRVEASGKSWPGWQTVSLDKYLLGSGQPPTTLYLKIQGTDCQVRELVLEGGG